MHPNITKIIDQYLLGELSPEEHKAFAQRLETNAELREELELQKSVQDAAVRASARADIRQVARGYRLNRVLKWGGTGLGIVLVALTTAYFIQSNTLKQETSPKNDAPVIAQQIVDDLSAFVQFDNVAVQYFSIPEDGDFKLSEQGVLMSVPNGAFLLNGKVYSGPSIVQYQEALDAATIVKSRLNTESGHDLLETQGMFSLQAYTPSGEKLTMNPTVGVYLQVPVDECKSDMLLFEGVPKKDGTMDWQNPSALEKIPVSVSMKLLDFYPVGYQDKLNALKWKKGKSSRDSLYLSFEDEGEISASEVDPFGFGIGENRGTTVLNVQNNQKADVQASFPGGYKALNDFIATSTVFPDRAIQKGITGSVYVTFTIDPEGTIKNATVISGVDKSMDKEALRVINSMPRWKPAERNNQAIEASVTLPINFFLKDDNKSGGPSNVLAIGIGLSPEDGGFPQEVEADAIPVDVSSFPRVSPSKVLAMWQAKFNNTNLATREFERRMKAIHSTCNDAVLEKYTQNLNKPIAQIDREVAAMGYSEFYAFAAEKVGAVNPNNPHIKNLQAFYKDGVKALKKEAKKNRDWEQKLNAAWDAHISNQRTEHLSRTSLNDENNFAEESQLNMDKALKETNQNRPSQAFTQSPDYIPTAMVIYPQFKRTASFTLRTTGACNIDSFVAGVTRNRETGTFKANGNTATITYNDFTFAVANPERYIQLFAYVFPNKLQSYQLINGKDGMFDYPLNDQIIYDFCVVGITEEGYEYFQKQSVKKGKLGNVKMKSLTELDLDLSLNQLNGKRMSRDTPIFGELNWIKAEQKNYTENKKRVEQLAFRAKIIQTIYPCYSKAEEVAMKPESPNNVTRHPNGTFRSNPLIKDIGQQ